MEESQSFPIVLRGYARDEVDAAIGALERRIAETEAELESARSMLDDAGLGGAKDLAAELDAVARDVGRILQEARAAADEMRSRAAADAARWRADADAETRRQRSEAAQAAAKARGDAWEEGTALLESAVAESEAMLQAAAEDALYLRAEAEREALRLTSDARRERDEAMRRVKEEGEQILAMARKDAETILSSARHQAEAAQERARALEARRAELLTELEAARSSIGLIEAEATETEPQRETDEAPAASHWAEDEASVRIVAGTRVVRSAPVDALELAAEVEALQRLPIVPPTPEPATPPPPAVEPEAPIAAEEPEPMAEAVIVEEAEETVVVESVAEEPVEAEAPAVPEEATEELPAIAEPAAAEAAEPEAAAEEPGHDHLSDLFASLRSAPAAEPPEAPSPPTDQPAASVPEPPSAPAETPRVGSVSVAASDPEVRDRLLLPVQNRALRDIKRTIVDLQNRVLEELRVEPGWTPDEAMFSAFDDELAQLQRESVMAGFTAARELCGAEETPRPEGVRPAPIAERFASDLRSAVTQSLEHSRNAGAGARETAAAVSRVFRAWRTDEAEKRVRIAAQFAYEEALNAGLDALSVEDRSGVSPVAS